MGCHLGRGSDGRVIRPTNKVVSRNQDQTLSSGEASSSSNLAQVRSLNVIQAESGPPTDRGKKNSETNDQQGVPEISPKKDKQSSNRSSIGRLSRACERQQNSSKSPANKHNDALLQLKTITEAQMEQTIQGGSYVNPESATIAFNDKSNSTVDN